MGCRPAPRTPASLGAYTAFTCGVLIWGWLEISFYMGFVTGPRRHRCAAWLQRLAAFRRTPIQASLYHELAVLVLAAAVVALTWGRSQSSSALWTFVVLWWMHQSARLNVFLGVSNLNAEFLPEHLDHHRELLRAPADEPAVPVLGHAVDHLARSCWHSGRWPWPTIRSRATGFTLLATLMVLAILEHWFLVLPISADSAVERDVAMEPGRAQRAREARRERHRWPLPRQATIGGRP